VFQSFNLYPHMTALENITLAPTKVKRLPRARTKKIGTSLLARVGLSDKAKSYPALLSGDSGSTWPSRGRWRCSRT